MLYLIRQQAGNLEWKKESHAKPEVIAEYWKRLGREPPQSPAPSQSQQSKKTKAPPRVSVHRRKDCDTPACYKAGKAFFYVERILDKRTENGKTFYLIKWIGYDSPEDNSWEPEENLDCEQVVNAFNLARERELLH